MSCVRDRPLPSVEGVAKCGRTTEAGTRSKVGAAIPAGVGAAPVCSEEGVMRARRITMPGQGADKSVGVASLDIGIAGSVPDKQVSRSWYANQYPLAAEVVLRRHIHRISR